MANDIRPEPGGANAGWLWRTFWRVALILLAVYAVHLMLDWVSAAAKDPGAVGSWRLGVLALMLLAYALLMAIPFVPGIEIGLMLLALEGARAAPFVYAATVTGLMLAYLAGEWLPYARLHRLLADFRLHRACRLLERLAPLGREQRLALLHERLPRWCAPFLTRFRYLLIALAVNLPGNAVLGGGGGILFVAGLSRLFHPVGVAATLALAVAPVPLLIWGFDINLLAMF